MTLQAFEAPEQTQAEICEKIRTTLGNNLIIESYDCVNGEPADYVFIASGPAENEYTLFQVQSDGVTVTYSDNDIYKIYKAQVELFFHDCVNGHGEDNDLNHGESYEWFASKFFEKRTIN